MLNDESSTERKGGGSRTEVPPEQRVNRGLAWVIGAFVICPCHLPLTLGLAATLLAGTALGAALRGHPIIAGSVITLAWAAATWRGIHLMRSAGSCPVRASGTGRSSGNRVDAPRAERGATR